MYSASTHVQCDAAVTAEYGCSLHSVICHILATGAIGGTSCVCIEDCMGLATQDVGQAPARTCVAVQTEGRDQKSANATPSVGEFRPQAPYCSCQDVQVFRDPAASVGSICQLCKSISNRITEFNHI